VVQALLGAAVAVVALRFLSSRGKLMRSTFWVAAGLFVLARVFSLAASPSPFIDVYVWITQRVTIFWRAKTRTSKPIRILYASRGHSSYPAVFQLPAGTSALEHSVDWFFKDVRVGYIFADAIFGVLPLFHR